MGKPDVQMFTDLARLAGIEVNSRYTGPMFRFDDGPWLSAHLDKIYSIFLILHRIDPSSYHQSILEMTCERSTIRRFNSTMLDPRLAWASDASCDKAVTFRQYLFEHGFDAGVFGR